MSELEKRKDASRYDCRTTEELQEILRKHAHGELETEPDTQELFEIMEVLLERRQNTDAPAYRSDEEAFAEFCEHYMPKEKEKPRPKVIVFSNRVFKTVAAVLAIALVLTVGTTLTAKAFHIDIWSKFANWTKEIFQFADNSQETGAAKLEPEYNLELKSLQDALAQQKITERIVPNWLPEGYVYKDLTVKSSPKVRTISAVFEKVDEILIITIRQKIGVPASQVEKNDDLLEVYAVNGVEYYIFSNTETLQAAWSVGEFECVMIGKITLEEMKMMIGSI